MERTLVIIKPDAVKKWKIGEILARFEAEGLKIIALKMVHLTLEEAQQFYDVHQGKEFFDGLCRFMSSMPVAAAVLEGNAAIMRVRKLLGATDPKKALPNSIRHDFGTDIQYNAVHGSDAPGTAAYEIPFFFNSLEMHSYPLL